MIKTIAINAATRKSLENFRQATKQPNLLPWAWSDANSCYELNGSDVLAWLAEMNNDKQDSLFRRNRHAYELLRTHLLHAVYNHLSGSSQKRKKEAGHHASWFNRVGFLYLGFAGTVWAICDGFYGITSIFGLFTSIPMWAVFLSGLAFSFLSVAVFWGFGLVEISRNLGVKLSHSHELLDIYLAQVENIRLIRKHIKMMCEDNTQLTEEDLRQLLEIVRMLKVRFSSLDSARKVFVNEQNGMFLSLTKFIVDMAAGFLFLGDGFFSGQSLFLQVLGLCNIDLVLCAWPVLAFSVFVGVSAFLVYWFVERPGLEMLVGRWFGLDSEKIESFSDKETRKEHLHKLNRLEQIIMQRLDAHSKKEFGAKPVKPTLDPMPTPSKTFSLKPGFFGGRQRASSEPKKVASSMGMAM